MNFGMTAPSAMAQRWAWGSQIVNKKVIFKEKADFMNIFASNPDSSIHCS